MNLVELVQGQLSADVIGKLAGMLGTNSDTTRTAVTAAVPTLLGAFGSLGARHCRLGVPGRADRGVGDRQNRPRHGGRWRLRPPLGASCARPADTGGSALVVGK